MGWDGGRGGWRSETKPDVRKVTNGAFQEWGGTHVTYIYIFKLKCD